MWTKKDFITSSIKQYSQTGFAFVASYEDILNTNAELYNVLAFSFDDEKRKKAGITLASGTT